MSKNRGSKSKPRIKTALGVIRKAISPHDDKA
jgi:hypothetical protein